jgi:hypothetical protein
LEKAIQYLSFIDIKPKKSVTKKQIQKLADKVDTAVWGQFKKLKGIK